MRSNAPEPRLNRQHVQPCIDRLTVRTKTWLEIDGHFVIGEHGFELLAAVERCGSLAGAAKDVGWSYRHAWGYVKRAERVLGGSLLLNKNGKGLNRGAVLSPLAREIVPMSQKLANDSDTAAGL